MKMLKFNDWLLERTHEEIDKETEEVSKEHEKASAYDIETYKLTSKLVENLLREINWPVPILSISNNAYKAHLDNLYIYFEVKDVKSTSDSVYLDFTLPWRDSDDIEKWKSEIKCELNIGNSRVNFSIDDKNARERLKVAGKLVSFIEENIDKIKEIYAKGYEFENSRKDGGAWKHADKIKKLNQEKEKLTEDEILSKLKKKEVHEVEEFSWKIHNGRRGRRSNFYSQDGFFKIEIVGWKPDIDPSEYIVKIYRHQYPKHLGSEYEKYLDAHRITVTRKEMIELAKMFLPEFRGTRVAKNVL